VVFNGHVHTTEAYQVDGVKYFVLGGRWRGARPNPSGQNAQQGPGRLSAVGPVLERRGSQRGLQLLARGSEARTADEVHHQSLPAMVG
jgi:hypothetical protein